jgi:hypothetical protein
MKFLHVILVAITYFVFTLWQFLVLYTSKDEANFVSLSAVYLTSNGFMLYLMIFLNLGSFTFNMKDILAK